MTRSVDDAPSPRDPVGSRTTWKVGELAREAGVSVRTLHHYEEIGLLVPSQRTAAGHRVYTANDAARLGRVRALTSLGASLAEVKEALLGPADRIQRLLDVHLARAEERLMEEQQLIARLQELRALLAHSDVDDPDAVFTALRALAAFDAVYTPAQREQLAERYAAVGQEGAQQAQVDWATLYADVRRALDDGVEPSGPQGRALAARHQELIDRFTGGDPGLAASLQALYSRHDVKMLNPDHDPRIDAFIAKAKGSP